MRKLWMVLAALVMAVTLAGVAEAGGRARVEVGQVPSKVEAGRSFQLAITVIPETWTRKRNLEPVVTAQCGDLKVVAAAVPLKQANRYTATLNLPATGEWRIRVDSRYCHTVMTPLAIEAVAGQAPKLAKAG